MTPHQIITSAVTHVAQPNDKYNHEHKLISFLMNHTMQTEVEAKRKLQEYIREQQKYYVNALVVVTVQVIASIWPNSVSSTNSGNNKPIADLNTFLHHILKYSRTTHSTLQLAIFYLFRIRARAQERNNDVYVSCGRRMFLAALISAHKYLQDKTYKNSAWSKVSGLSIEEINHAEKVLLELLDYRLYVKKETYDEWITILQSHLNLGPLLPSVALETTTTTMASTIQHTTYQHRLNSIRKAEQSLPSPPLDEDISIHDPIQKRKNTCLYEPEDDRITKRRR